uniref:macrophage mannose receptor 1-like isoform X1 n=1 Tax=Centroberyx gerrardi TaxID=166262 RepID=UPI003AB0C537
MVDKSSPVLPLSFLLIAALSLEASVLTRFHYLGEKMNWTEAQQFCQKKFFDLVTLRGAEDGDQLAASLEHTKDSPAWIGLHRSPENDSVWRWTRASEGGSPGEDVSQSSHWAEGEQSSVCALVEDQMWYARKCSKRNHFYCSNGDELDHHKKLRSWYGAKKYCQQRHTDLATITEMNTEQFSESGWIGLYREAKIWRWSGQETVNYTNWAPGHPADRDCGTFELSTKLWYSNSCSKYFSFVCDGDNLVLVKENKTWEEALEHCRAMAGSKTHGNHLYDLVSLQTGNDHTYARERIQGATTNEVWTGLRFLAGRWLWVNGEPLRYQDLPLCPAPQQHCGTLSKDQRDHWGTRDCRERRNFICYEKNFLLS